jgi:endonuclease G
MKHILSVVLGFGLALSAASAQEVHIVHCLKGCPTGAPATNDLVVRELFALSSNDDRKFADWVAYRVTKQTIGTSASLDRDWKPDPALDDNETLEKNDYTGASAAHDYQRGHQAPLASLAGSVFWRTTNFLSNITPQKADLNAGAWGKLEEAVRHAAYHRRTLYVITGPLYDGTAMPDLPGTTEPHTVPTGYWKIISTKSGRMTAFTFEQNTPRDANYCDHRQTLANVESRSGLNLFPQELGWPNGSLDADLGC